MTMSGAPEIRMAVAAARLLTGTKTCFVGIGVPSIAAMLAQRLPENDLNLVYESGVIGAMPEILPLSTGSACVADGARMIGRMIDVFGALQAGRIDVGLLSAAQVDIEGNLNSTVIGPYDQPVRRLPGSGGALDIALLARELLILMPHEPRRLVRRVDFVTSPAGRRSEGGSCTIVTDQGRFRIDSGNIELTGYFEDLEAASVSVFGGVSVRFDRAEAMALPTAREKAVLETFVG